MLGSACHRSLKLGNDEFDGARKVELPVGLLGARHGVSRGVEEPDAGVDVDVVAVLRQPLEQALRRRRCQAPR